MRAVGTLMVCDAISRSVLASPARGGVEKTACGFRDGGVGKKIISIQLQPPIITTTPQSFEKRTRHFSKSSSPCRGAENTTGRGPTTVHGKTGFPLRGMVPNFLRRCRVRKHKAFFCEWESTCPLPQRGRWHERSE